ncbi:unnamed protein product [Diatraea saccharalis]|uniref:Chitin-binding type-2 domain-containing protein n=1 Tax=Diatraea saccharalis TaxID=40085 RepID=A0A9N9R153_9NEOP|nr:unnamed protein product [Diatraea saccharalis]
MELWTLILCVIPVVASITVSSNGNSPNIKMIGGMMVDVQKGFTPIMMSKTPEATTKVNLRKTKLNSNFTKLSINERYRRLIPYMTFYYANDLVSSTTESAKDVEVEKAEIVEAKTIQHQSEFRQPKKIYYNSNRNIPLYQGNRLTQYNIASANPTKYFHKGISATPQTIKNSNFNPLLSDHRGLSNNDFEYERIVPKPIFKAPSAPFSPPTRRPYLNFYENEDSGNIRYYIPDKDYTPKYKLVPYEQTPPVKVAPQVENIYHVTKPLVAVPVQTPKEQVYVKPRPVRPVYVYDNINIPQSLAGRKQPSIVSESYYEKQRPHSPVAQPVIESGFKPILSTPIHTTQSSLYQSSLSDTPINQFESEKQQKVTVIENPVEKPEEGVLNPNYFQYLADQPTYKPTYAQSNTVSLADLLNSLQINKSIPKPITRENVGASIMTLLQVLNALKSLPPSEVETPILSTPKPFIENKAVEVTTKPEVVTPISIVTENPDFHDEAYLAPVNTPSQHIDDFPSSISSSQRFPLPITSDDEGGTPGRPGVDYPILTIIPQTAFNCKTQRYKGFFADPETRCQVWHYCDLNGGQASFLCPNGTIFSQAGLTCDWWFNVRCASTAQLYVLNESLYKYILPHSPKFPEDYSGPLVDKYLTLKFKEMEEQFKKNKHKQSASEKMDSDGTDNSKEDSSEIESSTEQVPEKNAVSEASVIVGSPGTSGNVERLQD